MDWLLSYLKMAPSNGLTMMPLIFTCYGIYELTKRFVKIPTIPSSIEFIPIILGLVAFIFVTALPNYIFQYEKNQLASDFPIAKVFNPHLTTVTFNPFSWIWPYVTSYTFVIPAKPKRSMESAYKYGKEKNIFYVIQYKHDLMDLVEEEESFYIQVDCNKRLYSSVAANGDNWFDSGLTMSEWQIKRYCETDYSEQHSLLLKQLGYGEGELY